ncbi:MAG TPA: hypothetical protein VGL61_24850 [Kofleriaceae bacterium]|jgi:hypothetical protein
MRLVAVAVVLVPALAYGAPRFVPVCPDHSCKAVVQVDDDGNIQHFDTPMGYGVPDLQMMYDVDPTLGAGRTIAIVDAYGYTELEADLAAYRSQYSLPPCSVASGCLTILNSAGQTTPLLPDTDDGWIEETALDVDMISAACPMCKIVVVQTDGPGLQGLQVGQLVAAKQWVDTISDSWGGGEDPSVLMDESDYQNPGIGEFVASGDDGYAAGPSYPATSAYTIAVGGTEIDGSATNAWNDAQSGCSTVVPTQPWSPSVAPCGNFRAFADISAYAAPSPGVATYVKGSWGTVGGTSAASPFSAALFSAAGHPDAGPAFVYKHASAFTDVTGGSSGSCGSLLCEGAPGWDGPTGLGTPDQGKLAAIGNMVGAGPDVMIGYPNDGDTVSAGFTIEMGSADAAIWTLVQLDGSNYARLATAGTTTAPLTIADGAHSLTFTSYDLDHNSQTATINVTVGTEMMMGDGGGGCCSASGNPAGSAVLCAIGFLGIRRRRRRA